MDLDKVLADLRTEMIMTCSCYYDWNGDVPSLPLVVRGLDLASGREQRYSMNRKEDLCVMVTVMDQELEAERDEKSRLSAELEKIRHEKDRLFEQSQAAAKQLRKFTSLFLESTPEELEKARQKFAATK